MIGDWLYRFFGISGAGPWYGFWSGIGADFSELAVIVGAWHLIRRCNCHVHGCWRIGRHAIEGTPHVVCRRHHPDDHPGPTTG